MTSGLDPVLTKVRARVAATWSQALVVLAGLAGGAVLVLLVAADLLARRRSSALRTMPAAAPRSPASPRVPASSRLWSSGWEPRWV